MTTPTRHADAAYTDGLRDLANMDHVSAELAGVLRDCAGVIDSQATTLAARSPSPDGLQEPALREALDAACDGLVDEVAGMIGADQRQRIALSYAEAEMRNRLASLALPQQAATDEGEAYRRGIYDAKVWLRDQQHKNPPDSLWHAAAILADRMDVALLSTPTSQPPAAETRLREALERLVLWADQMTGRVEPEYGCIAYARGALAEYDAALTQPEPTAQQGGGGQ